MAKSSTLLLWLGCTYIRFHDNQFFGIKLNQYLKSNSLARDIRIPLKMRLID
jgi:hypothetical protein